MVRKSTLGVMLIFFCLLLQLEVSESAEYNVGGANNWTYGVVNWPNGKSFIAGDVLVFKYDPQDHNVAVVDAAGYGSCKSNSGSKIFTSGHDKITLVKGVNYFICSVPGHCQLNMKIAVTAT